MEKLDGKSMDLVQTNIEALKQLFPEVVTEGKIDFEKLKIVLGEEIEKRSERYEFTWHGKTQAMKLAQTPSTGTLRPDKQSSKNWDTTENVYIEGDNLEVLKLLQKSYFGKIKMIYIDPPYNTGKDFVYKDDFRDNMKNYKEMTQQTTKANTETNGRYHTDWLNMMYPRLKLARNLLREDGVIFISIDDHEMANLKKICDEIFGEDNFIGNFIWRKKYGGGQAETHFVTEHEYIMVYRKGYGFNWKDEQIAVSEKEFNKIDENGRRFKIIKLAKWGNTARKEDRPSMHFPITAPDGSECIPYAPDGNLGRWRIGREKMEFLLENDLVYWEKKDTRWEPYEKQYFDEGKNKIIKQRSILYNLAQTGDGSNLLTNLFNNKDIFENPKPLELIKLFMSHTCNDGDIVLDFFAGSSTTAHAVMEHNFEQDKDIKFLMIQLPEPTFENSEAYKAGYKNICEIGKERIRRAGEKIVQETAKTDLDIGFKVFTLDSSNMKTWDPDFENLEQTLLDLQNNMKEDRTKEDLLYEILLKIGLPLTTPIEEIDYNGKTIYNVGFGSVLLCLENDIDLDIVHEMMKHKSEHLSPKVIFKESGFMNDSVKINAIQTLKKNGINDVRSV